MKIFIMATVNKDTQVIQQMHCVLASRRQAKIACKNINHKEDEVVDYLCCTVYDSFVDWITPKKGNKNGKK